MRFMTLLLAALLSVTSLANAASFVEGTHYRTLPSSAQTPTASKEVRELFFYGCSHCYDFEKPLNAWLARKPASVKFVRQAALFDNRWAWSAAVFYTAQTLGIEEAFHKAMFEAQFGRGPRPASMDDLVQIFVRLGQNAERVRATLDSFSVRNQIEKSMQLTRQYDIDGVPSLIVNGRYLTSPSMAGDQVFAVVEFLLRK
jgi:thiol:disulfide interchange protein DsbA